jgi:hypothetical protein
METQALVIQKNIDSPINEDIGYLFDSINRSSHLLANFYSYRDFKIRNLQSKRLNYLNV